MSDGLAGEAAALVPCPPDPMTFHPLSTLVNKPPNDDARCVEAVGSDALNLGLDMT